MTTALFTELKRFAELKQLEREVNGSPESILAKLGFQRALEEHALPLFEAVKTMHAALEPAVKYLESCGYDKAEQSDPEFQMLNSFREALARVAGLLGSLEGREG